MLFRSIKTSAASENLLTHTGPAVVFKDYNDMDARILRTIIEKFDGGPVGVATIAAAIGEDPDTIEEVYEPFLVMHGFLQRTARGRVASAQAYRHLGFTPPQRDQASLF